MSQLDEILDFHRRMFGIKDKDFNVQLKQCLKSLLLSEAITFEDLPTPIQYVPIEVINKLFGEDKHKQP